MRKEVHIFGGQGSPALFHDWSLAVARKDARTSRPARDLLASCHASLVQDCLSLSPGHDDDNDTLSRIIKAFPTSQSLLSPPEYVRADPVVEGITLCLYQLLRFLSDISSAEEYECRLGNIRETIGFCSGVLPAVVVAASPTLFEFVKHGVAAFRAAFWIGHRAGAYSRSISDGDEDDDGFWTWAISGLGHEDVAERLSRFNKERSDSQAPLTIASVLRSNVVTVSGPSTSLDQFLLGIPDTRHNRPVEVHALYHGGEQMRCVVDLVLQDFERLHIVLPEALGLRIPVREASDGSLLSAKSWDASQLAKKLAESILIKPIDWPQTLDRMASDVAAEKSLDDDGTSFKAVSYGPFSSLMMSGLQDVSVDVAFEKVDVSHENHDIQIAASYQSSENDIAIIGVGLDFPNGANLDDFWQSLVDGRNFVQEAPEDRFGPEAKGEMPRHGNFIPNAWEFDNKLFNISPREAKSMDPQQRILLQCSYHALEHAGYLPDSTKSFRRDTFGCFVGVATGDYASRLSSNADGEDVYYSTGNLRAFLSGRISYYFGHGGPSVVVDTACSGSTVAIHQACQALIQGQVNCALAGGINIMCGPEMQRGLARAHFLSSTGQCRPFEASADGYCRAEGCGMFVVKRLSDAIAENDRILGVIKGSGVNQSGTSKSITHPHAETQQSLMERVLKDTGIIPGTISVVEAHGTGTQAGDPIEFTSITGAFGDGRGPTNPLTVTSIKGNIGHAEAASGSAGLLKLLKMMSSAKIPPQVGLHTLNPKIQALRKAGMVIPQTEMPWPLPKGGHPRRALLNNFGAAGSNACIVLEEYQPLKSQREEKSGGEAPLRNTYIFALSAKDKAAFERARAALIESLKYKVDEREPIQHLAYTSLRRPLLDTRLVVTAKSSEELLELLEDPMVKPKTRPSPADGSKRHQIAFVFSGQGSQYIGMGRDLFKTVSQFRTDILHCEGILNGLGRPSILPVIQGGEDATEEPSLSSMHCAVLALQYALARLWISWGVKPDAVFGHSLGEYAALVTARVITVRDALAIVSYRALLIEEMCEHGESGMIAVNCSSERVQELLFDGSNEVALDDLSLACDNSPNDCVLAGSTPQIGYLLKRCKDSGIRAKKMDISLGYHSPVMENIRERLDQFTSTTRLKEPKVALGLGLHGKMFSKGDIIDHRYFSVQAASTVRFRETIEDYQASTGQHSPCIFLEIGSHPILSPMVKAMTHSNPECLILSSLNKAKDGWETLAETAAELARNGVEVQWRRGFDGQDAKMVDLPLYRFAKDEFMVTHGSRARPRSDSSIPRCSSLLLAKVGGSKTARRVVYEAFSSSIQALIDGHRVVNLSLCPASVYVELALQAAQHSKRLASAFTVKHVSFSTPLIRRNDKAVDPVEVVIEDAIGPPNSIAFYVARKGAGAESSASATFCRGLLCPDDAPLTADNIPGAAERRMASVRDSQSSSTIRRKMLYETIFTRVVSYSPTYQTIDWLKLSDDGKQALGSFRLRYGALLAQPCVSQPVFVDTLLHAAGFLANCYVPSSEVGICTHIEGINTQIADDLNFSESFSLYTEISSTKTSIIGNSYAFDPEGNLVASIQGIEFKRLPIEKLRKSLCPAEAAAAHDVAPRPVHSRHDTATHRRDGSIEVAGGINTEELEDQLLRILIKVTGRSDKDALRNTNFEELGVDSLMMIELFDELRKEFRSLERIPEGDLMAFKSLSELKSILGVGDGRSGTSTSGSTTPFSGSCGFSGTETPASSIEPGSEASPQKARAGVVLDIIREAIAEVARISKDKLDMTMSFEELGLDSLMSIELLDLLRSRYDIDLPASDFEDCKVLGDVAALVNPGGPVISTNLDSPQGRTVDNNTTSVSTRAPVLLQKGPQAVPPLYLVHDGSGMCNMFGRMGNLGRDVYGISAAGNNQADGSVSVVDLARSYASMIDAKRPMILGGWSFGGVVAYEIARILRAKQVAVLGVMLIDSPCPTNHQGLPSRLLENICKGKPAWLLRNFEKHAVALRDHNPKPHICDFPMALLQSKEPVDAAFLCGEGVDFLDNPTERRKQVTLWEKLTGQQVGTWEIPGHHFQAFDQGYVDGTSRTLLQAIEDTCRV